MKVVFRVDSSSKVGSGHLMRCLTLAQKLKKEKNAEVYFLMRNLEGNLIDLVNAKGFTSYVLPKMEDNISLHGYEEWLTVSQELDAEQSINIIKVIGDIDLIVIDSYAIDILWEKQIRPFVKQIMVIDDLANRKHDCDILLDQNLYEDMLTRYDGLVPSRCKMCLGPQYVLLREEFYNTKRNLRERDGSINDILIFFGGVDATNETEKTLQAIELLELEDVNVNVVVGNSNVYKDKIKEHCAVHENWHYYCQVNNIAELMAKADLAIGAGGTTTWERCFLGLPAIVVAVAENQIKVAEVCASRGIVLYLGTSAVVTVSSIKNILKILTTNKMLDMSNNCKELMRDGNGIQKLFEACCI